MQENLRVLFIGNSFTYYNGMPDLFENLASSSGKKVEVSSVTKGGYALVQFSDKDNEYGKKVYSLLEDEKFDVIFLQEQSTTPISNKEKFAQGVASLVEMTKETGARIILYQTWGKNIGAADLETFKMDTSTMAKALAESYASVANEYSLSLSPVGDAFLYVFENHTGINLYAPDGSHPSPEGSMLAALCHYICVFGESASELEYNPGIDEEVFKALKEAADKACFNS